MLVASHEEIEAGGPDIIGVLFHTKSSRTAAEVFLQWFRNKGGRASKDEIADFTDSLAAGNLGCRLSRSNFYAGVFKKFIEAGLISLQPEFDHGKRKVIQVYRSVTQPIPKRRPPRPSLVYNAHMVSERWNSWFS